MKILVTGFDPFAGESINPAWKSTQALPSVIQGAEIVTLEIPTVFHKSAEIVKQAVREHQPDVILCVGQAGGRIGVTPERVAINLDDARIPDNEGNQPIDEPIQESGENAYFSSLPVKAMVEKMKAVGVRSYVSNSAGTFVCNHIMYQVLYLIAKEFPEKSGGFIHVPFAPEQVKDKPNMPSLAIEEMTKALIAGIEAIVERQGQQDIEAIGGQIH